VAEIDPSYGVGWPDYSQTGSFFAPVSPPTLGPFEGSLVGLPCVNYDWLRLLLGASDQLRNPSTWKNLTPTQTVVVLSQVEELQAALSQAGSCVTCPLIRLQDCVLQSSCDGGSTWTDVAGWAANFQTCVQNAIPPSVPPNPGADPHDQHACNLAGYLATKVIQETMVAAHTVIAASGTELQFGIDVMALIGYAFPITYAASLAFHDFYNYVVAQSLSEINTASTDPTLWSEVTCAIYAAIVTVGYVDSTNFTNVAANLNAISYVYGWVPISLHNYWLDLGLPNIQSQQAIGALDNVDCSACGLGWCYYQDFKLGLGFWSIRMGSVAPWGVWTAGVGIVGSNEPAGPFPTILADVTISFPSQTLSSVGVAWDRPGVETDPDSWLILQASSSTVEQDFLPNTTGSNQSWAFTPTHAADTAIVRVSQRASTGTAPTLLGITLRGTGPNPFGRSNCT